MVVENGSRDATPEILGRYGPTITVVRETQRTPAAARKAGFRRVAGDVVAFTDADCVVVGGRDLLDLASWDVRPLYSDGA